MTLMETAQLLGDFGEFFGAIVVVMSLIYVGRQVRDSSAGTFKWVRSGRSCSS